MTNFNYQVLTLLLRSPLGNILVEGTPEYVSGIRFLKDDEDIKATGEPSGAILTCINELGAYFEGTNFIFSFPFRQEGTYFQQQVWTELCKTNAGVTLSYLDLSKNLGNQLAIRAVANAIGKNKLAIVVPCHRIIGTNRSLTGYNAGLWRKKWLLQHEAQFIQKPGTLF